MRICGAVALKNLISLMITIPPNAKFERRSIVALAALCHCSAVHLEAVADEAVPAVASIIV